MKKAFFLLLAVLFMVISISPITSVYATEVNWGDPVYVGSEDEKELGTKMALLYLLPDLLMQGVSDITIDNTGSSNLDDYLMDLYGQISEYSDEGLQELKTYIDDKANDFVVWAQTYQDPIVDGTLSTFFNGGNYKTEYKKGKTLGYINRLSRLQSENENGNNPPVYPDENIQSILDEINTSVFASGNGGTYDVGCGGTICAVRTFYGETRMNLDSFVFGNGSYQFNSALIPYISVYINYFPSNQTYNIYCDDYIGQRVKYDNPSYRPVMDCRENTEFPFNCPTSYNLTNYYMNDVGTNMGSSDTLSGALNIVKRKFHFVNIYLDNELISYPSTPPQISILSTGGVQFIYNTNQPLTYYFTEPVEIDYEKLYEIMLRAFQQGEPVSMTTINQGDVFINSNNTTIAPEADVDINIDNPLDGDFISTLVGVMALPTFNSSMVQPLMNHVGSATVIATTYVSAIPSEIIELLGACLVISLFICIMHRMLE